MKKYKPTTPSRRHMTGVSYGSFLSSLKNKPFKKLTKGLNQAKGRNNVGKITTRHKGGGSKRLYRQIDFNYDKRNITAVVKSIEYDPNRSGFIALIVYQDGEKRYILAPHGLKSGDKIIVSEESELGIGNRLPLSKIQVGAQIYNIEMQPGAGAKLIRSAGSSAEVLAHDSGYVQIKLPSGEIRKIRENCWASMGSVANPEHGLRIIGKAGRSRWLGKRPTVRGSAMNPVDHPFGGGEGKSPQGTRRPKNKWGKGTRGVKTRKVGKYSDRLIIKRRKKKKKK